jgi:hypothetical protein
MNALSESMSGCPAAPVIVAVRAAKTPLAIADAATPGAPVIFANDAFGALLGIDPGALAGRSMTSFARPPGSELRIDATVRLDIETAGGEMFAAALSTAAVPGPDGTPLCLLCSLVDARGEGADAAIARDAELLREVARAAGELMKASGMAADAALPQDHDRVATRIASEAVNRAVELGSPGVA